MEAVMAKICGLISNNKRKLVLVSLCIFVLQIIVISYQYKELKLADDEKMFSKELIDSLTADVQDTISVYKGKISRLNESIKNLNEVINNQKREIDRLQSVLSNKGIGLLTDENPYQYTSIATWQTQIRGHKFVGNQSVIYQATDSTFISYGYKFTLDSVYLGLQFTDYYRLGSSVDFVLTATDETYLIVPVSIEGKYKYDSYRYPFETRNIVAKVSLKRKWNQYESRWIKQHYDKIGPVNVTPWRYGRYGSKKDCSNHQRVYVSSIPGCEMLNEEF